MILSPFWEPSDKQKRDKMAPEAVQESYDSDNNQFWKHAFRYVVTALLEHQASQESPNTAKKPPKLAPESLQEPLKTNTKNQKSDLCLSKK